MSRLRYAATSAAACAGLASAPFIGMLAIAWVLYVNGWIKPEEFIAALQVLLICCGLIAAACSGLAVLVLLNKRW